MSVPIYIPTRGTVTKTYDNLPDSIKKDVVFFTDNVIETAPIEQQVIFTGGIADKRQACVDHAIANGNEYMVIVDDDVVIYPVEYKDKVYRQLKQLAPESSYKSFYEDSIRRFNENEKLVLISDHIRAFINADTDTNSSLNNFCIHNLKRIIESGCVYNRIEKFEDIDFILQLISSGYEVYRTKILSSANDLADYKNVNGDEYKAIFEDWVEKYPQNVKVYWDKPSNFAGKNIPYTIRIRWKYSEKSTLESFF